MLPRNNVRFKYEVFDKVRVTGINLSNLKILKRFLDTDGSKLYNLKGEMAGYMALIYSVPEEKIENG